MPALFLEAFVPGLFDGVGGEEGEGEDDGGHFFGCWFFFFLGLSGRLVSKVGMVWEGMDGWMDGLWIG